MSELRELSGRELRLTLNGLTPEERAEVARMLESAAAPSAAPSFELLVGLSPWLLKAVDEVKADAGGASLTQATKAALLKALNQVATPGATSTARPFPPARALIRRLWARKGARAFEA